ncbi:MAG TPA: hypothetical protein VFX41_12960 [Actinomycetales bacterium]|jgi:hypothetical protein|nr:hypothetical protein [Actinomycetales bacterium]
MVEQRWEADGKPPVEHRASYQGSLAESDESEQQRIAAVQHALQTVILAVGERHQGAPVAEVEEALTNAIAEAGIPAQPHKWVHDTAVEIAGGRLVVMNAHEQELLGRPHEKVRRPVDPERDTTS